MHVHGLGARIKAARTGAGLSQAQLAEKLEVRAHTVYRYERAGEDGIEPKLGALVVIANLCGVTVDWLATGQGDGPATPGGLAATGS